ncbi:unnamed protein product [Clonostachys rosea]|uniref:Beta-mannosidase B n=1 Tax=Bionectria ochroleuca TaxID=29856 RepID=A0ABY6TS38_BIOOC|nr:unnamed protein product [Clonostachys rosea]
MPRLARREQLSSQWTFKQTDDPEDAWLPVARVPTVSHIDLIDNGRIADPFVDMNELDVEWVGEKSWTYRTFFSSPELLAGESVYLLFDGLDTFATVKLNDRVILTSDNMFLAHRVEVTSLLAPENNTLVIDFDSALLRGREIEKQHVEHRYLAHNGESGRLGVRKAQYHWGWDWGPVLMTAGPWKPVSLEVSSAFVQDVLTSYDVHEDLTSVSGTVNVEFDGSVDEIRVSISHQGAAVATASYTPTDSTASIAFEIFTPAAPKLWYPKGYGEQAIYEVEVELVKDQVTVDRSVKKTGFRRAELVQKDDKHGESFYFRVNNVDVFAGGSCWIPADNFLPRITPERYRNWVKLMAEGNQVMVRVWGGGIYEDDSFYDACDEFGVLVWQDFLFACGSYPAWDSLRESVDKEARQNLKRIRHHPSIVLYCGNNEDYQTQEYYKLDYEWDNKDPESWLKGTFPARYYYEHLLPKAVAEESPGVVYWPSSPFSSKGREANDKKAGDIHQWNFWHGYQEKYQCFDKNGGRFVSEFGLEAFPQLSTIESVITNPAERYPSSRTMDFHNKAHGHERRIATYIVENFRPATDLKGHIYLSQLMQSEALHFAYRGWRRQWGDERLSGGALVWQTNDCWPTTSWAIVDYYLRKKPGYHAIAQQMRPVNVCVQREHHDWSVGHARPAKKSPFDVWVASSLRDEVYGDVEIRFISIESGKEIKDTILKSGVIFVPNGTTDIYSGETDNEKEEPHVIAVRLFIDNKVVAREVDWPQPFKYLSFPDRDVTIQTSEGSYTVSAQRPTKGLVIEEVDGVVLSDNAIDIVPGDTQVISVTGASSANGTPAYQYLGQGEDLKQIGAHHL